VCVILGFGRYVNGICALLGYYTAYSGNSIPNFRDKLSLPYASILETVIDICLKMRPLVCHGTSVRNHHTTLYYIPEERRSELTVL